MGNSRRELIELLIGPIGCVMEQNHVSGATPPPELDGVLRRGVAVGGLFGEFVGAQVGIVDQYVGTIRQRQGGRVQLPEPVTARAEQRRAVVRKVGQGAPAVFHPVTERTSTLVGDLGGGDPEPFQLAVPRLQFGIGPRSQQLVRADREVRWGHSAGKDVDGALVTVLLGKQQSHPRILPLRGAAEGKALEVVPVEVAEEDGATECRATEQGAEPSDPGPRIQHQPGTTLVVGDSNAGGVSAVAEELGT